MYIPFLKAPAFVYNQTELLFFSAERLKLNILEIDSQNIRLNTQLKHAKNPSLLLRKPSSKVNPVQRVKFQNDFPAVS